MNRNEFDRQLKSRPRPVIVDFWAPWCGPCRMTKPILEDLAREYEGRVELWPINADESPDLMQSFKVYGIPTVILFSNGKQAGRYTGVQSRENYRTMYEALANGTGNVQLSLRPLDRMFRLGTGAILVIYGFSNGIWLMMGLGAVLAFLGIYDRCPIWRAVSGWFKERFVKA